MKSQRSSGSNRLRRRFLLVAGAALLLLLFLLWGRITQSKAPDVNLGLGSPKGIRRKQQQQQQQQSVSPRRNTATKHVPTPKPTSTSVNEDLGSAAIDHSERQQIFFNPTSCEEEPVVSSSATSSELRFFSLSSGIAMLRPVGDPSRKLYVPNEALVIDDDRDSVAFNVARDTRSGGHTVMTPLVDSDAGADSAPLPHLICSPPTNESSLQRETLSWVVGDMRIGVRFVEKRLAADRTFGNVPEAVLFFPPDRDMHFYGLPSRGAGVELSKQSHVTLMNLDVNHYELLETANLYGSVPLLYAVDQSSRTRDGVHPLQTVGFLWLNGSPISIETSVDMKTMQQTVNFRSVDGGVKLFLLPGPTPLDVLRQYYFLTGHPMLPPLFSLGYHQCRWSYRDQSDVLAVSKGFDEHEIPVDAIWLDIDHTNGLRYFTFDRQKFPDPVAMQKALALSGSRKIVTITDPHIKTDSNFHVYQQAHAKRFFVRTSVDERSEDFKGHCWPGQSSWIDFANPAARSWYSSLFAHDKYDGSTPTLFSWNDMNEPSVFSGPQLTLPMESGHHGGYEHRQMHNLYGFFQTMATFGGHLHRSDGKQRPFVLTRSFFAGSQQYAAVWTGDNQAKWSHLEGSVSMLLQHSLGGVPFIGADVGGFFDHPEEELLIRWYQLGSLYPFFRGHSHTETPRREPWLFSSKTNIKISQAIRFRYCLLPYLYTAFWKAHMHGDAVFRPLMFEFPQDREVYGRRNVFMLGADIFVKPVVRQNIREIEVSEFPATGCSGPCLFYDFWTGVAGSSSRSVKVDVNLADVRNTLVSPLFIKEGAIVPLRVWAPSIQTTSSPSPMELKIALSQLTGKASGELYLDDGESTRFAEEDESCLVQLHAEILLPSKQLVIEGRVVMSECSYLPQEDSAGLVLEKVTVMGLRETLLAGPYAAKEIPASAPCDADPLAAGRPATVCSYKILDGDGQAVQIDNFHLQLLRADLRAAGAGVGGAGKSAPSSSSSSLGEAQRAAGVGSSHLSATFRITVALAVEPRLKDSTEVPPL
jgi:alpha-glucosidase (family GH31 glycosyl hydrolase)